MKMRLLQILICLCLVATMLASCVNGGNLTDETIDTESETEPIIEDFSIEFLADYRLIYPQNTASKALKDSIYALCDEIEKLFDVRLAVRSDFLSGDENPLPREILIGNTNRAESQKAYEAALSPGDWAVERNAEKIVLSGKTDLDLIDSVTYLTEAIQALGATSKVFFREDLQMKTDGAFRMPLRIGSYNIKHGEDASYKMELLGKNITDKALDIVGLQEVDQKVTRSLRMDTMKLLSEATGYQHYAFFKAIPFQGGEYGIAILSKYPILETELYTLESGSNEQRVLGRAAIDVEGETIQFFVTHLSYESLELRQTQFAEVNEILKGFDNFILTGDFNTGDFEEFRVLEGAAMVNDTAYSVPTFPKTMLSIDNIVYSTANWCFENPMNLTESYSDHYMLYASGVFQKNQPK